MPHAFSPRFADGTLSVCLRGDLWQTLPGVGEVACFSYYGPVEGVEDAQLSPKYQAALVRLRQRWIESQSERRGTP